MIFANSAPRADGALKVLQRAGLVPSDAFAFHPAVQLEKREQVLRRFATAADGILVCSGLGARGIDLPNVELVIEYQMAPNIIEHVHRVGRTARAGREGRAITLVNGASENEAAIVKEVQRCRQGGWKYV